MFDYDYTFCIAEECPRTDCFRHQLRIPQNTPVAMSDMSASGYKDCSYYESIEDVAGDYRVNINTASQAELAQELKLGPVRCKSVLRFRERNGRFTSVKQLLSCRGIGAVTYDLIKDKVCV